MSNLRILGDRESAIKSCRDEIERSEKELGALESGTPLPMQVIVADTLEQTILGPWDKQIAVLKSEISERKRELKMWGADA